METNEELLPNHAAVHLVELRASYEWQPCHSQSMTQMRLMKYWGKHLKPSFGALS